MLDPKKFAMFILTHGRPNSVITYKSLRSCGYTGKIYIIIDNEDTQADEYTKIFGKEFVIQFDKAAIGKTFDIADTRTDRRATVYARNASFQIAKDLGLDYFMQLDDDYKDFWYRWVKDNEIKSTKIMQLDQVIDALINFLDETNALSVAMAQGGDYIGGSSNLSKRPLIRKAMNSWLFRTNKPANFVGRMNDDVNTYITHGTRGDIFLTATALMVDAEKTQVIKGGMSETYIENGTYMKSMYTVMMQPSSVTVRYMGLTHPRLHHSIKWNNTVPKIINDKHKKPCEYNAPA
jgi:hypothetical protein